MVKLLFGFLEAFDSRRTGFQLKVVAVGKRLSEVLLMGY